MSSKLGFAGIIIASGLFGAFGISFLFVIWTWLFHPKLFGDGQYGMIFLFTFPLGWLVGSLVGSGIALWSADIVKPLHPFLTSIGVVIGGTIAVPIPGMMFMMVFFAFIGLIMELFKR